MNLEILKCSTNNYEVIDYSGNRLFDGTRAECEEYIAFYESEEEIDS